MYIDTLNSNLFSLYSFKKGLYLAQAVQMAFFVALVIQIATCIRYRIWMKESKNTMASI